MPPKRAAAQKAEKTIAKTAKQSMEPPAKVARAPPPVRTPKTPVAAAPAAPAATAAKKTPRQSAGAAAAAAAKVEKSEEEAMEVDGVDSSAMKDTLYISCEDAFEVDEKGEYSETVMIGGFPWRLWVCKYGGGDHQLFVECLQSKHTPVWYADVSVTFKLLDQGYGVNFVETRDDTASMNKWLLRAREYDRYMSKNCGGDSNTIEAEVTITVKERKADRFRPKPVADFFTPNEACFDGELSVAGKKMYINKQFVASHSSFFRDLFFGDAKKTAQKTFTVDNVKPEDLAALFGYLYWVDLSGGHTITIEDCVTILNYAQMAALGVQFDVPDLLAAVESFMMDSYEVAPWKHAKKLREAEKYGLDTWMEVVLDTMDSEHYLQEAKKAPEWKEMGAELKQKIEEKLLAKLKK